MPFAVAILRSSAPTGLLVWSVIGLCAGVGLFFYGFRLLQRRRLILDTPMSKIRSASLGMVEISGLATGPYTMSAPITQRACYYYRTLIWEWKQSGKNKQWVKIAGECLHVPFFIDDGTGLMLVDPRGADLDIHRDFQQEFNGSFFSNRDDAPANVNSFLVRHGIATSNKIKVEEFCIKPKNALFVLGTVAENSGLGVTPCPIREPEPITSLSPTAFSLSLGSLSFSTSPDSPGSSVDFPGLHHRSEVVRISSPLAAKNTSEMTQQQKIAAALMKAGISSPAAWAVSGVSGDEVASMQVLADPVSPSSSDAQVGSGAFVLHPSSSRRSTERRKQQNLPDLLAQPAGSRQSPCLEMHAHDLGRPGSCDAQPLRAPEHYESGSLRIATRLLTLRLSQGFSLRRCIKVEGRPLGPRGASENLCGLAAVVVSANAGASRRIVSRCVFRHPDAITRQCTTVLTLR